MRELRRLAVLPLLATALALPLAAQKPEAQLAPTSSPEAVTAFRTALYEAQNVSPARARNHVAAALAADSKFGLAGVYQEVLRQGMTPAQREAAIAPQLGAMGTATPAEVLLALYWRETAAGRGPAALPILKAVTELVPADAEIAYMHGNAQWQGKPAKEQAAMLRGFVQRFPEHAAAFNQLAYTLWRAGDADGALAAVQQYERLAPNHPNSHDSHADILLLMGRGREALPHVQRELELDPTFVGAHAKMGTIALTLGDVPAARNHFVTAVSRSTTPADRIEALYWQVATYVYEGNGKAAIAQLAKVVDAAQTAQLKGQQALAHNRTAVLEAYMGRREQVSAHLAAARALATTESQITGHHAHAAIALSRAGQPGDARAALREYTTITGADDDAVPVLEAILALDARDYPAAQAALDGVTNNDLLTRAARAEVLLRTGRKAEGKALRQQVLDGSVKLDGNPPLDFLALLGRIRAQGL